MIHKNPITKFMYRYGYDGVEDIYDYFFNNEESIISTYERISNDDDFKLNYVKFMHKIKWSSVCGIFLRFEISQYLSLSREPNVDMSSLSVRFDGRRVSIGDFNLIMNSPKTPRFDIDLRGACLVKMKVQDKIIKNINFDYSSILDCEFNNVQFINCSFRHTVFTSTKLLSSVFNESCIIEFANFEKALIASEFLCEVNDAEILPMEVLFLTKRNIELLLKYPRFTIIRSKSFAENSNNKMIQTEYLKQYKFRK